MANSGSNSKLSSSRPRGLAEKPVSPLHGSDPKREWAPCIFQVQLVSSNGELPPDEVQMNRPNAKEPVDL